MNRVSITGRLIANVETVYTKGENPMCVSRATVAVKRKFKAPDGVDADFVRVISFGKTAEFFAKYFTKGMKAEISGHIQTGSYTNKEGKKVYTTDVVIEEIDFGEARQATATMGGNNEPQTNPNDNVFMDIPAGIDEEIPFA